MCTIIINIRIRIVFVIIIISRRWFALTLPFDSIRLCAPFVTFLLKKHAKYQTEYHYFAFAHSPKTGVSVRYKAHLYPSHNIRYSKSTLHIHTFIIIQLSLSVNCMMMYEMKSLLHLHTIQATTVSWTKHEAD